MSTTMEYGLGFQYHGNTPNHTRWYANKELRDADFEFWKEILNNGSHDEVKAAWKTERPL